MKAVSERIVASRFNSIYFTLASFELVGNRIEEFKIMFSRILLTETLEKMK